MKTVLKMFAKSARAPKPVAADSKKAAIVRRPLLKFGHICLAAHKRGKSERPCLAEPRNENGFVTGCKFKFEHMIPDNSSTDNVFENINLWLHVKSDEAYIVRVLY